MENSVLYFEKSDGWLFTILLCHRNRSKLKIKNIIRSGDFMNRSIISLDEINNGLSRLVSEGFIEIKNQRLYWQSKGKQFIKEHRVRFELIVDTMLRHMKIFHQMSLTQTPEYIRYFSEYDYQTAVHEYSKY